MKTARPAHRGIMPQALGALRLRVSREIAKYSLPKKPGTRMTAIPARARGGRASPAAIVVNPSAASQAFAQMAAEEPMMPPPQYKSLDGAQKAWGRLAGQNLLPKLIANVKFKHRIEASPPQPSSAA
ncbi:MAG: hypothetical protein ACREC4_04955 [Methylocella sp.]